MANDLRTWMGYADPYLRGRMVRVTCGPGRKGPVMHCELAVKHSQLIKRAVESQPDDETVTVIIDFSTLPDISSEAGYLIPTYIYWVYEGRLATADDVPGDAGDGEYGRLLDMYDLGVYLEDFELQNSVLDSIIARDKDPESTFAEEVSARQIMNRCYNHMDVEEYMPKKLLVALFADKAIPEYMDRAGTGDFEWPDEFLQDVCKTLLPKSEVNDVLNKLLEMRGDNHCLDSNLTTCDFHVHLDDEQCRRHTHVTVHSVEGCPGCPQQVKRSAKKTPAKKTSAMRKATSPAPEVDDGEF